MTCAASDLAELISLREFAKRTKLSPRTVRRLRDEAGLPVYDLGDQWQRVLWSEALEWLTSRRRVTTNTTVHR